MARASGESVPLRLKYVNILGSKNINYPVPAMTRKEIREAEENAAKQQMKATGSSSALQTGFILVITGVLFTVYL